MNFKQYFLLEDKIKLNKEFVNEFRKEYLRVVRSIENTVNSLDDIKRIEDDLHRFTKWLEDYLTSSVLRDFIVQINAGSDQDNPQQEDFREIYDDIYDMREAVLRFTDRGFGKEYRSFEEAVEKQVKKIRYYGRKLIKVLNNWIDFYIEDEEVSVARKTTFRSFTLIAGGPPKAVAVSPPTEEQMERAVGIISGAYNLIKKHPELSGVIEKPMKIYVAPIPEKLHAAEYQRFTDSMTLYDLAGGPETAIHELGHRYYYMEMSGGDRKRWAAFYENNHFIFSQAEIEEILEIVEPMLMDEESSRYWEGLTKKAIDLWAEKTGKKIKAARLKEKIPTLHGNFDDPYDAWVWLYQYWKGAVIEEPMMLVKVSMSYGESNEKELFAEVFRSYVLNEQLPEYAFQVFKEIIR